MRTVAGQDETVIWPWLEALNSLAIALVGDVNVGDGPERHDSDGRMGLAGKLRKADSRAARRMYGL